MLKRAELFQGIKKLRQSLKLWRSCARNIFESLFKRERFHEFGRKISLTEILILHQLQVKRYRCFNAFDHILTQRPVHSADGFFAGLRDRD